MQGIFKYGGVDYDLMPRPDGASAEACGKLVELVLKQNEPCGAEQVAHTCIAIIFIVIIDYSIVDSVDIVTIDNVNTCLPGLQLDLVASALQSAQLSFALWPLHSWCPLWRGMERLGSTQGIPSLLPHGMVETPHGVAFSFLYFSQLLCPTVLNIVTRYELTG